MASFVDRFGLYTADQERAAQEVARRIEAEGLEVVRFAFADRLRPCTPQLLDHAEAHAASSMHGHSGRLVDRQHMLVLEQGREFTRWRGIGLSGGGTLRHAHRRHAHHIARLQPAVGLGTPLVDADLAAADDAVDVRFRHPLEYAQQIVVETLAFAIVTDLEIFDAGCRYIAGIRPYNVFHCESLSDRPCPIATSVRHKPL